MDFKEIITWLLDHWPHLALVLFTAYFVWKASTMYHRRFVPMEEAVKKFNKHANCKTHKNSLAELTEMVRNIEKILIKGNPDLIDSLSITMSPRQLSDKGKLLYKESGCETLLANHIDYFIEQLELRTPKTALDAESESHSVLLSLSDEDKFNEIKKYLYNHPKFEGSDIDINTLCFLMSLELRNSYLDKHTEIIP